MLYKSTKADETLQVISFKMIGTSCTDDARVKVPSFQKVTFFATIRNIQKRRHSFVFCLYEDVSDCHI